MPRKRQNYTPYPKSNVDFAEIRKDIRAYLAGEGPKPSMEIVAHFKGTHSEGAVMRALRYLIEDKHVKREHCKISLIGPGETKDGNDDSGRDAKPPGGEGEPLQPDPPGGADGKPDEGGLAGALLAAARPEEGGGGDGASPPGEQAGDGGKPLGSDGVEAKETPEVVSRDFLLRGPALKYFLYQGREALMEGGTRTGKSWAFMIKAMMTATQYPGSRQLICRQTRKSLNESILKDWREEILWIGHEAVSGTATREHQDLYRWKNGAEVYFAGLENMRDTASPILSTKWDRVYICQAEETSQNDWGILTTRLSSWKTPHHQITADCNPAAPSHWLNARFSPDKLGENRQRFPFRHYDNPSFYRGLFPDGEWTKEGAEYVKGLEETLTGVRRERFLLHKWVAAEGQILDNWDTRIHSINAELENDPMHGWLLHVAEIENPIRIAYFTVGVDWGWDPDPGCFSLWGYDSPRWHPLVRRFRCAEVMKVRWQGNEWADLAEEWWAHYGVKAFSCDPADPEKRNLLNIRIGKRFRRSMPPIAVKCPPIGGGHRRSKHHASMIDLMRDGLGTPGGHVRSFFLKDAFPEGIDEEMRKKGRPTCYEQEVESWVYAVSPDGTPTSKPDDKCDQHAIMCFVAGTKILTSRGNVPIELVGLGDTVLVPYEDEVVAIWESDEEVEVWELETGIGRLVATGNHCLWTRSGWKELAEINGDELLAIPESASNTTDFCGGVTRTRNPSRLAGISSAASGIAASFYTATPGSARSAGVESATTSTIETEIPETTGSKTLKSSRRVRINGYTVCAMPHMRPAPDGTRTQPMQRPGPGDRAYHGRIGLPDHELAAYVESCSRRDIMDRESDSARIAAIRRTGATHTPTITIAGAPRMAGKARVFNLTVKRTSRYIANGIMVANCAGYDEVLNFARGFGRGMAPEPRFPAGTDDELMRQMDKDMRREKRGRKDRSAPWE